MKERLVMQNDYTFKPSNPNPLCIKGEIYRGVAFNTVRLSVDDICRNNNPHFNLITFCLLNDLLLKWEVENEGDGKYYPNIQYVDLTLSEDEEKNRIVREMFKKYDIQIF